MKRPLLPNRAKRAACHAAVGMPQSRLRILRYAQAQRFCSEEDCWAVDGCVSVCGALVFGMVIP